MKRLTAVLCLLGLSNIGCSTSRSDPATSAQYLCRTLMAEHSEGLARLFESDMMSPSRFNQRFMALQEININPSAPSGRLREPEELVQDAFSTLAVMPDAGERRRLEYVILGSEMSLEERRQFEQYCVVPNQFPPGNGH